MVILILVLATYFLILLIEGRRVYLWRNKKRKLKKLLAKTENEILYLSFLLSSAVSEDNSIQKDFPSYLNHLKEIVGWAYHSMFRLDEKRQLVIARFTGYLPDWYIEELSTKVLVKVGDAAVGRAIATKQPVTINLANFDPRFQNVSSYSGRAGYRSLSCYPVIGSIKTYGGFCTYSTQENSFKLHDVQFFSTCANFFGAILENKILQNYLDKNHKNEIT